LVGVELTKNHLNKTLLTLALGVPCANISSAQHASCFFLRKAILRPRQETLAWSGYPALRFASVAFLLRQSKSIYRSGGKD